MFPHVAATFTTPNHSMEATANGYVGCASCQTLGVAFLEPQCSMRSQEQITRFLRRRQCCYEQAARPASLASGSPSACVEQPKHKSPAPCSAAIAGPSRPPVPLRWRAAHHWHSAGKSKCRVHSGYRASSSSGRSNAMKALPTAIAPALSWLASGCAGGLPPYPTPNHSFKRTGLRPAA